MSDTPTVRTEKITKQFGRFTALLNISIEIAQGEFVSIVGQNGAGKTTFLKILSTIIRTYEGDAQLFGSALRRAGADVRRRIGVVLHESLLYPDLTVADNLTYYARLYGVSNRHERVAEVIRRLDLDVKARSLVRSLSRGLRQRASLARAFLHEPDLLLLDEPFTGVDERAAGLLTDSLAEFKKRGGTIVMVTHNIDRAWHLADRMIILQRGTLAFETATSITTTDAFRTRYEEILGGEA
ncbi:MAG: ABC transporter ATP-binding protein [bacterium]|nr:ABC transporter ATP-binding protein [bacterium]